MKCYDPAVPEPLSAEGDLTDEQIADANAILEGTYKRCFMCIFAFSHDRNFSWPACFIQ